MNSRRRGVAAITVLVVLAVLAILMSVVTMQVVAQHRFLHQRERQLQAEYLAHAGIEWAAARLVRSGEAFSETRTDWQSDATVRITVEKSNADRFGVAVDVTIGGTEAPNVRRALTREFRRTENAGVARLDAIVPGR